MNYFILPHAYPFLFKKIDYFTYATTDINNPPPTDKEIISTNKLPSYSLSQYLVEIKKMIKKCDNDWDTYKEFTNPFEYIHTNIPSMKQSISLYKPLSRSYFKMVEIIVQFEFMKMYPAEFPIHTFHLAEGPGGFIEAFVNQRQNTNDKYVGMTLINESDKTIPSWKKSALFLSNHANVNIEYGQDGTGNLLSLHNFIHVVQNYGSKMHFVTADGGFDFSEDYNRQEIKILNLLYAQIAYALCLQCKGGTFVLKMFDCFMDASIDLLYLLASFYEKVYVTKPQTSRYANSERYIVCINFHFDNYMLFYPYLLTTFTKMLCSIEANTTVKRFFSFPIPMYFMNRLDESNIVIGMNQIENIYTTLTLIENRIARKSKIDILIKMNITKCMYWCMQHKIPFDASLSYNPKF